VTTTTNTYNQVFQTLQERYGKPVNSRVVCAALEAMGIRDIDVAHDYGFDSLEAMAQHMYHKLLEIPSECLKNDNQKRIEQQTDNTFYISNYGSVQYSLFLKDFSNGMFHLLPILFQLLAIIALGFSLWTYVGFNDLQATAVVLGLILGLTATGGSIQAMGKQVSYYWYQEDMAMCEKMVRTGLANGFLFLLGASLVASFLSYIANLYPLLFSVIMSIYAVAIGALLLVLAPLYTIKKRWVISVAVLLGTLLAVYLLLYSNLSIYAVHLCGIGTSLLLAGAYLVYFFRKKRTLAAFKGYGTPKKVVGIVRNSNYFLYGTLFYIFLFTDRIIAWSTTVNRDIPFILYYDKDYEIGMDLALLVFFLMAGTLEYSVATFSRNMERKQRILHHNELRRFQKEMFGTYKRHVALLCCNALVATSLLYLLVTKPWGYEAGFDETLAPLSLTVAVIGCTAYCFLTLGILNVLLLHTLNQSVKPIRFLLIALVVNLVVGLVASRFLSFEYSAFGLLVGSVVFMVMTTRHIKEFFKNLEYHYYATL
jgi:hypothetical protein